MTSLAPIDYDALRVALVRFVRAATGLDENHVTTLEPETAFAPRPTNPYVALKIMTSATRYGDDVGTEVAGGISYGGPRGMTVSLQSFGRSHEEAYSLMAAVQVACSIPAYSALLSDAGIAVWRTAAINDLSMLLNTGYEGRAQMDVFCGIAFNTAAVAQDTIAQATVVGTVSTEGATTTVTITGDTHASH